VGGAERVYLGVSAVDYSGYPDCRPEFIECMTKTIRLATKVGTTGTDLRVESPLIHMTKSETIGTGMKLNVPYHLTTSCYNGLEIACGVCDSCRLRIKGFKEAGYEDPVPYQTEIDWSSSI
jgi:7-cyano-7-deazaguanine synthase